MRNIKTSPLGCLSFYGILATLVTVFFVGGVSLMRGGILFTPGKLNAQTGPVTLAGVRSHAEISRCTTCHAAPWGQLKMADNCLACHTDLKQDPQNFHKVMIAQGKIGGCNRCHTDHRGPKASLTNMDLRNFPHNTMGYSLQAHQRMADGSPFKCSDCHSNYTGFDQAICASCHNKLNASFVQGHKTAFEQVCLTCHDGLDTYGHAFDHTRVAFALSGKHVPLTCDQCHKGARSIADLQTAPQDCYSCHAQDDVHKGDFSKDCSQCHTPDGWDKATFDHSKAAFPLVGKHQTVPCIGCHINNVFKGTPQDCYSCHARDDAHSGRFGQDCALCHSPVGWLPITFDHSQAAFQLVGKHQVAPCEGCHTNPDFRSTPQDCYSCHAKDDAHSGQLGQDCSLCHTPAGWLPSTFDHSKTAFPLTGAHLKLACTKCHLSGASGPIFKGTPAACAACHAELAYHKGLFGTACASCHSTSGWIPAKFNGPHAFPLGHGGASTCQDCHPQSLAAYTCFKCHDQATMVSKHLEQGITDISNCVKCHPAGTTGG